MDEATRFLRGDTAFGAEAGPPGAAHLVFVRADLPHGELVGIDAEAARSMPGVLGVFTAADLELPRYTQVDGHPDEVLQPPLALEEVRYVGQRIAAVVASTLPEALDAAAAVVAHVDPRPARIGVDAAAPVVLDLELGEPRSAVADDIAVMLEVHQSRVAPSPLEATTACAVPHPSGMLTLHVGTQLPAGTHEQLARDLGLDPARLRLIAVPMGGAFGTKTVGGSPDLSVLVACALALGQAVRFVEDRSAHTAVNQARDQLQRWTLTAGPDGRLRHIALEATADAGAYVSTGAMEPATTALLVTGAYRVDKMHVRARSVLTNTAPTGPYRGPGRAEAASGLERAMDHLAAELRMDPIELRRRNLLRAEDYPRATPSGLTYDASDPLGTLDAALAQLGPDNLRAEQERRRVAGGPRQLGLGVATWVDATAGYFAQQESSICVTPDGAVSLLAGAAPAGQGHQRAFAALVAEWLGVDPGAVELELPDTAGSIASVGSFGSRSGQVVASAASDACAQLLDQARRLAAQVLEASPSDVVDHGGGRLGVAGVPDRALSLEELGRLSHELESLPAGVSPGLASIGAFSQDQRTFPAGCHAAVVEVDVESGRVDLLRLVTATDCGTVLDADAALGQAQGSMVQGAAHALLEEVVYDASGNLLTGNLLAYAVPSAAEVPWLDVEFHPVPTDRNPLGAKGLGESGNVGAPAAVQNAIVDALSPLGVRHVDLPCTPERVWRAVQAVQAGTGIS